MKALLDTHAFIWWANEPARLSPKALTLCQDRSHTILLSLVSVWEIQIKYQLGKLQLRLSLAELIEEQQRANQLEILPITLIHILGLTDLPTHHRDPFDRLLIAQAVSERLTLISHDPHIAQYHVHVIW